MSIRLSSERLRTCPVSLAQALNFILCPEDNSDLEDLSDEDEDSSDPSFLLPDPYNNPQEEEIEEEIESGRMKLTTTTVRMTMRTSRLPDKMPRAQALLLRTKQMTGPLLGEKWILSSQMLRGRIILSSTKK